MEVRAALLLHDSLCPKKKTVILEFKLFQKKQIILFYLENACARKNQLVLNMDNK